MLKRPIVLGAAFFALLFILYPPLTTRAIDCLVNNCGLSGGTITGLRDTWMSKTGADTVSGIKTHSANVILDDGVTDSPSLTFTDATNETAVLLKTDSGRLGITTLAADGVDILVGNLRIGNGTPGQTIDGEDLYVEGISEFDGAVQMDGAVTIAGGLIEVGVVKVFNNEARVGATAGFVLGAIDTGVMATVAASQAAGTLVVPISGLTVGDTITAMTVHAQIESGGNVVTIDGDLRNIDNTAADPVDASVGNITQVSVTADTAVAQQVTGLSHVVLATDSYYVLVTVTTNASTDVQLININVTVTEG